MNNKLLKGAFLLLVCLFGAYVYMYPPTKKCCEDEKTENACLPITMPKKLVDAMIKNYKDKQLVAIQTAQYNAVPNDAQSVWFSVDELETFLETIECMASKDDKNLGVRFYYAAYPDASQFGQGDYDSLAGFDHPNYSKKHTLIMIPTKKVNGVNTDFNPQGNCHNPPPPMALVAKNHGILQP